MAMKSVPVVRFDASKVLMDMANKGWMAPDLARAAGLSKPTISLFLKGQLQTPKTAAKIARALGYTVKRYVLPLENVA